MQQVFCLCLILYAFITSLYFLLPLCSEVPGTETTPDIRDWWVILRREMIRFLNYSLSSATSSSGCYGQLHVHVPTLTQTYMHTHNSK